MGPNISEEFVLGGEPILRGSKLNLTATSLVWLDVARLKGYCLTVASKMKQASSTVAHDRQGRLHAHRWQKLCTVIEVASGKVHS